MITKNEMQKKKYETIEVFSLKPSFLCVQLNRPEVRNAFHPKMIEELQTVFQNEAMDSAVRGIVLKGRGPVFCAGGDLRWMKQSVELSYEENLKETRALSKLFETMFCFPKPLIAMVHGAAIGGGVGLVSVCDIVFAAEQTVFSLSEVSLGIIPACIGPFVVPKIGMNQARRFFLSSERFKAQKAKEIGLVHEVFSDLESMNQAFDSLQHRLLKGGPQAIAEAKKLILDLSISERREQLGNSGTYVAELLARLRVSQEGQEGLRAFLEKRRPKWSPS